MLKVLHYSYIAILLGINAQLVASENSSFNMFQLKEAITNEDPANLQAPLDLTQLQKQLRDTEKTLELLSSQSHSLVQYACRNNDHIKQIQDRLKNLSKQEIANILKNVWEDENAQLEISAIIQRDLSPKEFDQWKKATDNSNQMREILRAIRYIQIYANNVRNTFETAQEAARNSNEQSSLLLIF